MSVDIRPVPSAYFGRVTWIIIIAFVAFVALAVALLLPVHRMLKREEQKNEEWESKRGSEPGTKSE